MKSRMNDFKMNLAIKLRKKDARENIQYYLMMAIPLILIAVFSYWPLYGLLISFQNYAPGRAFWGADVEWVGLKWFERFVTSYYFPRIIRNTLVMNFMGLAFGFVIPIIFALIVNEIRSTKFKKFTQTVSYLPYFLSAVVVSGMLVNFLADDGIVVMFLNALGLDVRGLMANKQAFPWIYTITNIWKGFGWSSIIYLSTITAIDPGLYEAASIDGAGRFKKIWHITIPSMLPLIVIQLILSIGGMLGSNTDLILLIYNPSTYETADVIGTFTYREALMGAQFSYGTASGLLMSLLSFALTWIANTVSRKTTDFSMW